MKKRLTIEIPEELHQKIKIKAIERNITIRKWVTRLIMEALKEALRYEKDYKDTDTHHPQEHSTED